MRTPPSPGLRIDLNCDVGEIPALIADGTDDRILARVTSANIACGGHAGDDATMRATVASALRHGCAVGAHPGYDDPAHFGRRRLDLPLDRIADLVRDQVTRLRAIARQAGAPLVHVKPHGALYNAAADDRDLSAAIARGVRTACEETGDRHQGAAPAGPPPILVGLAGSPSLAVYAESGFRVAAEAFADRRYEPDGRLRSRALSGALLKAPEEAAAQAIAIARDGRVTASDGSIVPVRADTLCLHGDTPGAVEHAAAVRTALEAAGIRVAAVGA
jgi:5-oxoprolinase (ATP-hydrolysing) subunit A